MKANIPDRAVKITFEYDKVSGTIYVWGEAFYDPKKPNFAGEKWEWSALGNCGEEATYEEAVKSARNWVRGLGTKTDKEI